MRLPSAGWSLLIPGEHLPGLKKSPGGEPFYRSAAYLIPKGQPPQLPCPQNPG